jgi:hypothetical protein
MKFSFFSITKKPLPVREEVKSLARSSHLSRRAGVGIGTWSLQDALQPVAVASTGQSLSHSQ